MMDISDNRYKGMRMLLICPSNNAYPDTIKDVLESRGAEVHFYDERNNPTTIEKVLYRKIPTLLKRKIESYYKSIIEQEISFLPNVVLVICPEAITRTIIRGMKKTFRKACFIVYLWDSVGNKKLDDIFTEFDYTYSFDQKDCKRYGFKFRPLFFSREYYRSKNNIQSNQYKYDFGFIGTLHSDRPKVINSIRKFCNRNGLKYYFYFYVQGNLMLIYWLLKSHDVRELHRHHMVHTIGMPRLDAEKKMEQTRCAIDVNHPGQNGLTMRTIEIFGLQRKLVTTNKDITKYDFYNPVNQILIDKENLQIDMELIRKPYEFANRMLYEKYSVDYWVDEILEGWLYRWSKQCN